MSMNGIDISSYQRGINLAAVPCDFVIVKATEGTSYINPDCARAVEQALSLGKAVGVYHYINGRGAVAEANFFFNQCKGWNGRVVWCLDWESGGNRAWGNVGYLETVLVRLKQLTGRPPMLYASSSAFPWNLAKKYDCGTWVAQYASMSATGYQSTPWNEGAYSCTIRQYSSAGRLAGYSGNLDINKFYGDRAAWNAYAGAKSTATTTATKTAAAPKVTGTDKQLLLTVDGVPGGQTYARFNQVMGTGVGGAPTAAMWKKFQSFLNTRISAADMQVLTGASKLSVDGVIGPKTWKAFQYWSGNVKPAWMAQSGGPSKLTSATWNQWVDGTAGPKTWKMVQHMLNSSYANSGKLLSK